MCQGVKYKRFYILHQFRWRTILLSRKRFDGSKKQSRFDVNVIRFSLSMWTGPHNSVCGPGLGLKSYLRAGPGPKLQDRTGP